MVKTCIDIYKRKSVKKIISINIIFLMMLVLAPISYSLLTDDLVAYYKGDNSTEYLDSHNGFDGTPVGASYIPGGKINGTYSYNGVNENIILPNMTTTFFDNGISLSVWAKFDAIGGRRVIYSEAVSNPGQMRPYQIDTASSDRLLIDTRSNGQTIQTFSTNNAISTTGWYHIVWTVDNDTGILYVNGVHDANNTNAAFDLNYFSNTTMYKNFVGGFSPVLHDGNIDELAIWNRTITPEEVTELYNNDSGLPYEDFTPPAFVQPDILYKEWSYNITSGSTFTEACTTIYKNHTYIGVPSENGVYIFNETGHNIHIAGNGFDSSITCSFDNLGSSDDMYLIYRTGPINSDRIVAEKLDDWSTKYNISNSTGNATRLYSLSFDDIDNDGEKEMVGGGSFGISIKTAETGFNEMTEIATICHGGVTLGNIDDDPYIEFVWGDEVDSNLRMAQWNGSELFQEWDYNYSSDTDSGSDPPDVIDFDDDGIIDWVVKQNFRLALGGTDLENHIAVHNASNGNLICQANNTGGQGMAIGFMQGKWKAAFHTSEVWGTYPTIVGVINLEDCTTDWNFSLEVEGEANSGDIHIGNLDDNPYTQEIVMGLGVSATVGGYLMIFDENGTILHNQTTASAPYGMTIGDYNRDGNNSIIMVQFEGETISWGSVGVGFNSDQKGRKNANPFTWDRHNQKTRIFPLHYNNSQTIVNSLTDYRYVGNTAIPIELLIEGAVFNVTPRTNSLGIEFDVDTAETLNFSVRLDRNTIYRYYIDGNLNTTFNSYDTGLYNFTHSDSHLYELNESIIIYTTVPGNGTYVSNPINTSVFISNVPKSVEEALFLFLFLFIAIALTIFAIVDKARFLWFISGIAWFIFGFILMGYSWALGLIVCFTGVLLLLVKSTE